MKTIVLLGGTERRSSRPTGLPRSAVPNPYAACVVRFGHEGKVHMYLNAALPTGHHPSEGICSDCGHSYSHVIRQGTSLCRECGVECLAECARELEQAGINLGWGYHKSDSDTDEYKRERMRVKRPTHRLVP